MLLLSVVVFVRIQQHTGPTVTLAGKTFQAEIADTQESQERGLSGRDSLPADHAMVFSFAAAGRQCFWMKDMKFAIDMVWLDSTYTVTAIEQNVSPATYPQNFCHDGQIVIELAANTAQTVKLKPGDKAHL